MKNIGQKVINRLLGRQEPPHQVKRRVWYQHFNDLADWLETNPSKAQILKKLHSMISDSNGFHYAHIANSAMDSIDWIIKERGWKA